jgi:hypothetical protein
MPVIAACRKERRPNGLATEDRHAGHRGLP